MRFTLKKAGKPPYHKKSGLRVAAVGREDGRRAPRAGCGGAEKQKNPLHHTPHPQKKSDSL